jgi:hypothetical protein
MPAPYRNFREALALADGIAPRATSARNLNTNIGHALARHERAERGYSAAQLSAVEAALAETPDRAEWSMTGGGCSAWIIASGDVALGLEEGPYLMLTGLSDETEASGDLRQGTIVGLYRPPGWEGEEYIEVRNADPLAVGRAVLALLPGLGGPLAPHDCHEHAYPHPTDGPLGHGWSCGICGAFLQAG